MNTIKDLNDLGFVTFPLRVRGKLPTRKRFWEGGVPTGKQNVGISTTEMRDGTPLLAVDVDVKKGAPGLQSWSDLLLYGDVPQTFSQRTPTGGLHFVFTAPFHVRNSAGKIGKGLDVRGWHGLVVGAGSQVLAGEYTIEDFLPPAPAPDWLLALVDRADTSRVRGQVESADLTEEERALALDAAKRILQGPGSAVVEPGRNQKAFVLACDLKDLGLDAPDILTLMLEEWTTCSPPLEMDELEDVISHAFQYGTEAPGARNPLRAFDPVEEPKAVETKCPTCGKEKEWTNEHEQIDDFNANHAVVLSGGTTSILRETTNQYGEAVTELLSVDTISKFYANRNIVLNRTEEKKQTATSKPLVPHWMTHESRRTYEGLVFCPEGAPERFYNMWRGFAVQPALEGEVFPRQAHDAVEMWKAHSLENICAGNQDHNRWHIGFYAHLLQFPHIKPLTALVYRGGKGVGKNAAVGRFRPIVGTHYKAVDNLRFLTSNFNAHLERLLLFVLDEAFWSGEKAAEGPLKGLITGAEQEIERKGQETYTIRNLLRIVIIGNERWVVPASHDERRFAVFDVGAKRKQDKKYFHDMRVGLDELGGNRLLVRELLAMDLSGLDINEAPNTPGLYNQKMESLGPVAQWWKQCLDEGRILEASVEGWPERPVPKKDMRGAVHAYARSVGIKAYNKDDRRVGSELRDMCPSIEDTTGSNGGPRYQAWKIPPLSIARAEWDKYFKHPCKWEETKSE